MNSAPSLLQRSSGQRAPLIHPTAVSLTVIARDLELLSRPLFEARYGAAFLVLLASAPQPIGVRPRMTRDVVLDEGRSRHLVTAALPLRPRVPVSQSFLVVGRSEGCDVPIFDGTVSKMHALIEHTGPGAWRICDAKSRNGTRVEGVSAPVRGAGEPVELLVGAHVSFGTVTSIFVDIDRLAAIARAFGASR